MSEGPSPALTARDIVRDVINSIYRWADRSGTLKFDESPNSDYGAPPPEVIAKMVTDLGFHPYQILHPGTVDGGQKARSDQSPDSFEGELGKRAIPSDAAAQIHFGAARGGFTRPGEDGSASPGREGEIGQQILNRQGVKVDICNPHLPPASGDQQADGSLSPIQC